MGMFASFHFFHNFFYQEIFEHDGITNSNRLKELAISYNGGKDCLVVLVLFLAVIHQKIKQEGRSSLVAPVFEAGYKLDTVYVNTEPPFPELSNFIHKSTVYYHLNHIMINSSLKEGFEKYLTKVNPEVKAIIIGIRYSDPYGSNLKYEQDTDHHWPNFLRIHPILHWNYVDIWDFLIGCNIEYCEMYDEGYTSLGGIKCTTRNPYLRRSDVKGYNPAYMLEENADIVERSGRTK